MRLPARITLPFGYVIRIRQITKREMAKSVGDDALAGWITEDRIIYLLRSRTTKQKRADLAHEMLHALADYGNHILTSGLGKL